MHFSEGEQNARIVQLDLIGKKAGSANSPAEQLQRQNRQ
jgi:hypothetical protein